MLRDENSELFFSILLPNFLNRKFVDSLCTIIARNRNIQSKSRALQYSNTSQWFLKHYLRYKQH